MTRRSVSLLAAFLLLAFSFAAVPTVTAQDATPESALAALGLPELNITVTADSYEGVPEELEAGRYLLTVTATEETEEFGGGGIGFVQPYEMSGQEFLDLLLGPPDESGVGEAASTPMADVESTPADGEGESGVPEFVSESTFAGGTFVPPGQSGQIVLDLPPGEWVAWADDPEAPQEPVIFQATGEMPSDLPEPEATVTITMAEYDFLISDGELTSGQNLVHLVNRGEQPHFMFIAQGPDDMTEDQIQTILDEEMEAEMSGTPPAYSGINPEEELVDVFASGTQSNEVSTWFSLTLEPGAYVLVCFFPDQEDGIPHAFHGMYEVVHVGM